uniref:Uncharacterized protein n=1 Tax=Lactuca sativa TaxID=4236 RepID=A0A9R1VC32_LACSA|nr:hypothetical protein LSAT_V11C500295380 [Lactuca sativa]
MAHSQNRPVCAAMFRQSCFDNYVNMPMCVECQLLLCHHLMCNEVTTFDPVDLEELLFPFGDYHVCFDRKAFCLVTGLWFRDYFHPSFGFAAFRERVFPFVPLSRSVSMNDLTNMFNNSHHQLNNEDVGQKFKFRKGTRRVGPLTRRFGAGFCRGLSGQLAESAAWTRRVGAEERKP